MSSCCLRRCKTGGKLFLDVSKIIIKNSDWTSKWTHSFCAQDEAVNGVRTSWPWGSYRWPLRALGDNLCINCHRSHPTTRRSYQPLGPIVLRGETPQFLPRAGNGINSTMLAFVKKQRKRKPLDQTLSFGALQFQCPYRQ
ncbi:hypothetical protein HJG60_008047 [Phyllostomus discolor]|uniref:Uncharacterized protein n=1 Tax=Phyllostomus discolor TaxID=89673 RepID=A0A834BIY7_9CHIR|nr:hypothetical protein HJG60_008047 [Phyllostomus discolor]